MSDYICYSPKDREKDEKLLVELSKLFEFLAQGGEIVSEYLDGDGFSIVTPHFSDRAMHVLSDIVNENYPFPLIEEHYSGSTTRYKLQTPTTKEGYIEALRIAYEEDLQRAELAYKNNLAEVDRAFKDNQE